MKPLKLILFFFLPLWCLANNAHVRNLELAESNVLECDITWENSWHYHDSIAPFNHDALWVFCKGRRLDNQQWESILFKSSGVEVNEILEAKVASSQIGVIVKRIQNGEGYIQTNFKAEVNVVDLAASYSEIRLFAIEMVYVNEGAFYVGDSISNHSLMIYGSGQPFYIDSESSITVGQTSGQLYSNDDYVPFANIPSQYPKGYSAFYAMKYEISQQQYVDFLNTLTPIQQQNRQINKAFQSLCFSDEDHIEGERNFIKKIGNQFGCDANDNGIFGETDDGNNVACNFLTWGHITAYLDWSGLRPMTELEFEKASRGPEESEPLELVWGNANVVNTLQAVLSANDKETILDTIPPGFGIANFGYCLPSGPLRCGFAATATSTRVSSGATYYGLMEMSGNLWELCVNVSEKGLRFGGEHGDGQLNDQGFANQSTWESVSGEGSGLRGGGWNSGILNGFRDLAISDRFFAFLNGNNSARGTVGGRGVISKEMFE
ncbi:MAG: SUMF1/EgtB/PvdO family nonheme iron enzyme [Chitinophagales bacterium]